MDITAAEQVIDLTVGNDHLTLRLGAEHCLAHHIVTLDTAAIIGKSADIRSHTFDISQRFALFTNRNGTVGIDMDAGITLDGGTLDIQVLHRVRYRVQVRHGADCGITTAGRG